MKTKYILISLFISVFNLTVINAATYSVDQNFTISVTTGYVNYMNETWNVVSTVTDKPLIISYTIGTESYCDWLTINNVDNSGNVTSQLLRISGTKSGVISTTVPNGRVQVVFTSDLSICYASNSSIYSGINVKFSVNTNEMIDNGLFVTGNSYVSGNVGIGTISPTQKLDVNGNLAVGTKSKINISNWSTGYGAWIDIPVVQGTPSGIGSGGQGVNPWVAYAGNANQWFSGAAVGDICYRNTNGKLLFGNTSGIPAMVISGNKIGIGTTSPQNLLDVKGTIRATRVVVESIDYFPDFVFDKNYHLRPLEDVRKFINTNGHLPEIPSAGEVESNGIDMAQLQIKLLQKIEELTLYIIKQQQQIDELKGTK